MNVAHPAQLRHRSSQFREEGCIQRENWRDSLIVHSGFARLLREGICRQCFAITEEFTPPEEKKGSCCLCGGGSPGTQKALKGVPIVWDLLLDSHNCTKGARPFAIATL